MSEELVLSTEQSVLSIIERAATNPEVSPEKMHSLLDLQLRILDKQSEIAFNRDFSLASKELPLIKKNGVIDMGAKGKMSFAKYEDLDKALRPIEERFGFTRSFLTSPVQNGIEMTIKLTHREGHSITSSRFMPPDTGAGRNAMQAVGSASSYAKRYLTLDLWNIVTIGADDDAQSTELISSEQVKEIEQLIMDTDSKKDLFLKHLGVEKTTEIMQRDFNMAVTLLKQKGRQKK